MSDSHPRRPRVGRQFAWVSSGRIVAAAIQAIGIILLARALTPAAFGIFAAVQGIVLVAQAALGLGIGTMVMRERARDRRTPLVRAGLAVNDWTALVLGLAVAAILLLLGLAIDAIYLSLLPFAVWGAAERNADTWLGVAIADGDARVNSLNLVVRRTLALGTFMALHLTGALDPLLAFTTGLAVAAVASWFFARRFVAARLPERQPISFTTIFAHSWPYWLNSLATQARNLDAAIARVVTSPVQAGFYATAARITGPLRILPTSLASVLLPATARGGRDDIPRVLRLAGIASGTCAVAYLLLAAATPAIVPAVLGTSYVAAIPALQVTVLGLVFAAVASLAGSVLQGLGFKHFVGVVAMIMTATCLIGVYVGGTTAGAAGAAVGLASSYVIQSATLVARIIVFVARKEDPL